MFPYDKYSRTKHKSKKKKKKKKKRSLNHSVFWTGSIFNLVRCVFEKTRNPYRATNISVSLWLNWPYFYHFIMKSVWIKHIQSTDPAALASLRMYMYLPFTPVRLWSITASVISFDELMKWKTGTGERVSFLGSGNGDFAFYLLRLQFHQRIKWQLLSDRQ